MRRVGLLSLVVLALLVPATAQAAPSPVFSESVTLSGDPLDVVAGPDGALWFTARGANGVGRLTADGLTPTWFPVGLKPNGIAASPDGNLWFADTGSPGQIRTVTPGGSLSTTSTGGDTQPTGIVAGPDNALWFTEAKTDQIGRVTTGGLLTHPSTIAGSGPYGITVGPDGALWFTAESSGKIGRLPANGSVATMYALPDSSSQPEGIVAGPDGALWFTEYGADKIGRMTTGGSLVEYDVPGTGQPSDIVVGTDGALWFTDTKDPGRIGRVTTDGDINVWPITTTNNSHPTGISVGPDGALWFAESSQPKLGRVTTGPGVQAAAVTDASDSTATLRGAVVPASQATTYFFQYGRTASYGRTTAAANAGQGGGTIGVQATVTGLLASTSYHYRVVATNGTDTTYGPDRTFTTTATPSVAPVLAQPAADATAPKPVFTRSVVVGAASGQVSVKLKGTSTFVALTSDVSVPTGSELNTTKGSVALTSALDTNGKTQTATFSGGRFKVLQTTRGRGMTDLYLTGPKPGRCMAPNRATASYAATTKKTRSLWGRDDHGRFRTHGRDSVATVRGTRWFTQDRCDGTLTRVTQGAVSVRDLHRKRTKIVRAGHSYLARRR
jgi:virginiamycin B lyase